MQNKINFRFNIATLFFKVVKLPALLFLIGCMAKGIIWLPFIKNLYKNAHVILDSIGNLFTLFSIDLLFFLLIKSTISEYRYNLITKNDKIKIHIISILESTLNIIFTFTTLNVILSSIHLPNHYVQFAHNVVVLLVIVAITWSLLEFLSLIEEIFYSKYIISSNANEMRTKGILHNIIATIIVILAIAACLMVFDKVRDIGVSILASAGFLTALLALAAQKSLTSVIVGIKIALSRSIKIGDFIRIENQSGVIEEITLTYVTMRLSNNQRLVLPIHYFIEKPFQNSSKASEGLLGTVKFYVNYHASIPAIRTKVNEIVNELPSWDNRKVSLTIGELNENNVEIRVTVSAKTPSDLDLLSSELKEKMLDYLSSQSSYSLPICKIEKFSLIAQ